MDMCHNIPVWRICKYCATGGAGAVVDFLIYSCLVIVFSFNYLVANILSITVALILVYLLQKNWTFQYTTKNGFGTFQRYLVSVGITYLLNNSLLFLLVGICGYNMIWSKVAQIILATVWGYCLTNYYVFAKSRDE